jgi:hypothetical protein
MHEGKLYAYNVGSGAAVGLLGAELVVDALPLSFHVGSLGSSGSMDATVVESELTFAGLTLDQWTDDVRTEFENGILETLTIEAIVEVLSTSSGSLIINYQIIPAPGASQADLDGIITFSGDAGSITAALSNSAVLSQGTPSITIAPTQKSSTVSPKIVAVNLTEAVTEPTPADFLTFNFDQAPILERTNSASSEPLSFLNIERSWPSVQDDGIYFATSYLYDTKQHIFKVLFDGTIEHFKMFDVPEAGAGGSLVHAHLSQTLIDNGDLYVMFKQSAIFKFDSFDSTTYSHVVPIVSNSIAKMTFTENYLVYARRDIDDNSNYPTSLLKRRSKTDLTTEETLHDFGSGKTIKYYCTHGQYVYAAVGTGYEWLPLDIYKVHESDGSSEFICTTSFSVGAASPNDTQSFQYYQGKLYVLGIYDFTTNIEPGVDYNGIQYGGIKTTVNIYSIDVTSGTETLAVSVDNETSGWNDYKGNCFFKDGKFINLTLPPQPDGFSGHWYEPSRAKYVAIPLLAPAEVSGKVIGAYDSLIYKINDGPEKTVDETFTPPGSSYEIKVQLKGKNSILDEKNHYCWLSNI